MDSGRDKIIKTTPPGRLGSLACYINFYPFKYPFNPLCEFFKNFPKKIDPSFKDVMPRDIEFFFVAIYSILNYYRFNAAWNYRSAVHNALVTILNGTFGNAGLDYIEIPYNPYGNKKDKNANGIYMNFLQMQQAIIIPTFGIKEDDAVVKQFEELFKGETIATVDDNDIAYEGEILNYISKNILK
jgi:hypothetical protein